MEIDVKICALEKVTFNIRNNFSDLRRKEKHARIETCKK
jgi:hypothetical protein